jgi:hypothetical protein
MKLIGICGKARSGKDTVAKHLFELHAFTRIAFADPLKLAAQHMFGLSHAQTWDDNLKEVVIPYWEMSPRQMFQKLGTDATHPVFGQGIWLRRWHMTYDLLKDTDHIVVPDVRRDYELAGIRALGGIILRTDRDEGGLEGAEAQHISETGLSMAPDCIIRNNGSIADLKAAVDDMLERFQ